MTPEEALTDLKALEEELLEFERKYALRSEIFYAAYISGDEPENDAWVLDFAEWASVYQTWLARQKSISPTPDSRRNSSASNSSLS